MTTKLGKQASTDGQINKPGLSDGCRAKFLPSVARPTYNWPQFEGYMGNVGLNKMLRQIDFTMPDIDTTGDDEAGTGEHHDG